MDTYVTHYRRGKHRPSYQCEFAFLSEWSTLHGRCHGISSVRNFAHRKVAMRTSLRLTFFGMLITCLPDLDRWCPAPACAAVDAGQDAGTTDTSRVQFRGSLLNCLHRFEHDREGHVAFLRGSITEMPGYRPRCGERRRLKPRRRPVGEKSGQEPGSASVDDATRSKRGVQRDCPIPGVCNTIRSVCQQLTS